VQRCGCADCRDRQVPVASVPPGAVEVLSRALNGGQSSTGKADAVVIHAQSNAPSTPGTVAPYADAVQAHPTPTSWPHVSPRNPQEFLQLLHELEARKEQLTEAPKTHRDEAAGKHVPALVGEGSSSRERGRSKANFNNNETLAKPSGGTADVIGPVEVPARRTHLGKVLAALVMH
jgi:hypothetical protein